VSPALREGFRGLLGDEQYIHNVQITLPGAVHNLLQIVLLVRSAISKFKISLLLHVRIERESSSAQPSPRHSLLNTLPLGFFSPHNGRILRSSALRGLFFAGSPNPSCNFLSFLRNVPLRTLFCSDYCAISSDVLGFSIEFFGVYRSAEVLIEKWWWWTWARSSTPRSTSTTPTSIG
jgi:hypothetical protein